MLPGLSGQFMFNQYHVRVTIPYDDVKIDTYRGSDSLINKIVITNNLGVVYTFAAADNVKIETSRFYSLPNSPTYIDLNTLIKAQSQVQLRIVSQPRKGNLSELSKGVVQYFPNKDFTGGSDAFRFSVLSIDDKLLL